MAITGTIGRDGTVTITWNLQAEKLPTVWGGRILQYLPCEICGDVKPVNFSWINFICGNCAYVREREFELDGRPVEDIVEFMQQLEYHERLKALALKAGEELNLGGGAAPLFVLRRAV